MVKSKMQELRQLGQSIWLDYISRPLIEGGKLQNLIDSGLGGITSNPSIFDKAISQSSDYDQKIKTLAEAGKSSFEIYDQLTIKDIQDAADMLSSLYQRTSGLDGYVSLEVNPDLAEKTAETIAEAKRLHQKVKRPNLMVKIPATSAGFAAIEELLASGINVNATLIFSLKQYEDTAYSYIKGIRRWLNNGGNLKQIRSVASVFVSRIDNVVDKKLEDSNPLKGKAAIVNSQLIYKKYCDIFSSSEFNELAAKGASLQRALWASTSTKNPAYSDIKYITELIGKDTVNTIPEATLEAFLEHGVAKEALSLDVKEAIDTVEALKGLGIDLDKVCDDLLVKGVVAFQEAFTSLLKSIETKKEQVSNKI